MDKVAVSSAIKMKKTSKTSSIRIVLAGPRGKMGAEAIQMIMNEKDFTLVGCVDHKEYEYTDKEIPVFTDLRECLQSTKPDVFIDLTRPEVGYTHTCIALEQGVRSVIGTSGFTEDQLRKLTHLADEQKTGCIIAPNFALGAVLMMKFSQIAGRYFPDVEIIEKHHDQKVDAPSGTAIKTSELIHEARAQKSDKMIKETESIKGVRGGNHEGIHIHSVRLPGLVAHQEVVFGGEGETLTIKHDSLNRSSFMEGIKLCIEEVMKMDTCIYGLENIIDFDK